MRLSICVCVLVCAFCVRTLPMAAGSVFTSYSFTPVGFAGGAAYSSRANAASFDGSLIVGRVIMNDSFYHAFRWTRADGMTLLDDLPGGVNSSQAYGISDDGSVILGENWGSNGGEPALWTGPAFTATALVTQPGGAPDGFAAAITPDHSTVIGARSTGSFHAFKWTSATGIAFFTPYGGYSEATGVSNNGSVIVGTYEGGSIHQAFRWTEASGAVTLSDLPGGLVHAQAHAVSADGSVVVGFSSSTRAFNGEAVMWDSSGVHVLSSNPGPSTSIATAISDDGSIIVGRQSFSSTVDGPFIWDALNGMQNLQTVLTDMGLNLAGWKLGEATGISGDGKTIVGFGTNPLGKTEGWVVTIPEPSAGALGFAAFILLRLRSRCSRLTALSSRGRLHSRAE